MKKLKLILLSSILILTFKNGYSQARLGYTFDEIDKEFVIDSYSCTDKKFGKNIKYGYHFYIHLDGGIFCHFLNNDLVCIEGMFFPLNDSIFNEYVNVYNSYKNTEIKKNVWIVHDIRYNQSMKIEAFTSKNNPVNSNKKYFQYTLIDN